MKNKSEGPQTAAAEASKKFEPSIIPCPECPYNVRSPCQSSEQTAGHFATPIDAPARPSTEVPVKAMKKNN